MKNTWPEYERIQQERMKDYKNALLEESPFDDDIECEIMEALANNADEPWSKRQDQAYKWLTDKILQARHIYRDFESPVSADKRNRFATIARDAENLSKKILDEDFGPLAKKERFELEMLSRLARANARNSDPSVNPRRNKFAHYTLAGALVDGIVFGILDVPMTTNKDSQLARLFRACCSAAGLDVPVSGHNYLADAVKHGKKELDYIARKSELDKRRADLIDGVLNSDSAIERAALLEELKALINSE